MKTSEFTSVYNPSQKRNVDYIYCFILMCFIFLAYLHSYLMSKSLLNFFIKNLMWNYNYFLSAYGTKFSFSDEEVDFATFSDNDVDSAIFLQQRIQPLIATKALCTGGKKLYWKEYSWLKFAFTQASKYLM